jgi:small subunit ribosomal protein S9
MEENKEEPQIKEPRVKSTKTGVIYDHGRRKEAAARVRLFKGKGQTLVNEKPIGEYFYGEVAKVKWQKPFLLTQSETDYYATIKVKGSGTSSQLDAVVHGLSRALAQTSQEFRSTLKKAGLLTRDARVKVHRKYCLAQKARKGKQSPKR